MTSVPSTVGAPVMGKEDEATTYKCRKNGCIPMACLIFRLLGLLTASCRLLRGLNSHHRTLRVNRRVSRWQLGVSVGRLPSVHMRRSVLGEGQLEFGASRLLLVTDVGLVVVVRTLRLGNGENARCMSRFDKKGGSRGESTVVRIRHGVKMRRRQRYDNHL
jgi:hypothetical protein